MRDDNATLPLLRRGQPKRSLHEHAGVPPGHLHQIALARGGTKTARLWTYLRDDCPFGGTAPPALIVRFSRDRGGAHPTEHLTGWKCFLQADADAGYNDLYRGNRKPGPVLPALCWSHSRRKFFELASVGGNIRKRKARSAPLVAALERWLRAQRAQLSKHAKVAKAIDYLLSPDHWSGFTRFLDDGRVCLINNAAERSLRAVALGRKSWLFVGSERGGQCAAFMYSLIGTAKLNGIDPQAWLADVIARISDLPISRLPELLPRHWKPQANRSAEAA